MSILTIIGLVLFLGGFLLIGIGAESKSEDRKANLSFLGFLLLLGATFLLGGIILSQTLTT